MVRTGVCVMFTPVFEQPLISTSYAENLAAGTGSSYDIAAAVKSWTDEVCECIVTFSMANRWANRAGIKLTTIPTTLNPRISLR